LRRAFARSEYTADGVLVWTREAMGDEMAGPARPAGVAALADGSVYMTGEFNGAWSFGATTLVSGGASDIFVMKYAADGTLLWARQAGGTGDDVGRSIAVFRDGTAYVTGEYQGSAMFESTLLDPVGQNKLFLAKYASDGSLIWVKSAGGEASGGSVHANSVAVFGDGSAYVTGSMGGTVAFDADNIIASGSAGSDFFLTRFRNDGSIAWARTVNPGTGWRSSGQGVAALADGSVYLAGASLGGLALGAFSLPSFQVWTMFVAKFTGDGTVSWAREAEVTFNSTQPMDAFANYNTSRAVAVSDACTAYVVGTFTGSWSFGNSTFSSPNTEIFVAKVSAE
jgi:hypothetical protein